MAKDMVCEFSSRLHLIIAEDEKEDWVTQVSTAVSPSAFGALPVTELKMFTSTRNRVTSNAIRPAIVSIVDNCSIYV